MSTAMVHAGGRLGAGLWSRASFARSFLLQVSEPLDGTVDERRQRYQTRN
jgi:hypothetical protein